MNHLFGLEQNKLDGFFNALGYKVDENSKAEDLENEFGLKKKIHTFHGILKLKKGLQWKNLKIYIIENGLIIGECLGSFICNDYATTGLKQ